MAPMSSAALPGSPSRFLASSRVWVRRKLPGVDRVLDQEASVRLHAAIQATLEEIVDTLITAS